MNKTFKFKGGFITMGTHSLNAVRGLPVLKFATAAGYTAFIMNMPIFSIVAMVNPNWQ